MKKIFSVIFMITSLCACKSDIEKDIDKYVESFTGNWKIAKITYHSDESLSKIDSSTLYSDADVNFSGKCSSQSCTGNVRIYGQSANINYNPYNRDSQIFIVTPPIDGKKTPYFFFNGVYEVSTSGDKLKILIGKVLVKEKESSVKIYLEK